MADDSASLLLHEYVSAYDQVVSSHDWASELSEEWVSEGSAEPSEQGSARGASLRAAFGGISGKIDTIPEEPETSTVRIVLGESDAQNTPEWKRRLDEAKTAKDLFSPCHLENLFKDESTRSLKSASQSVSPEPKQATFKDRSLTNTAAFLKDITENISVKSTKPAQQSPLRQAFTSEDASSPIHEDQHSASRGTTSSGKSTLYSSDQKSTHESSDDDTSLSDPNEDLSIAEPTQTLMDPLSFYTARPDHDEITVHTPLYDSADESFRTAKAAQTPHPNASRSLSSSTETKSRSVRFAPPDDNEERSFTFDFTPQEPIEEPVERPQTPTQQQSSKSTPHSSPFKLFSRYDTFTNNKLEDMVANLLPKPDDEDEDGTVSREHKRARREALSRNRIPRLPQNQEIRHNRVPSLTTQEMFDDAEDFMRDLRSMPRPTSVETDDGRDDDVGNMSAVIEDEEEEEERAEFDEDDLNEGMLDDGNVSSEFEENIHPHLDHIQHSESERSGSVSQEESLEDQSPFPLSPGRAVQLVDVPATNSNPSHASRVSSAESMQVITPDDVLHLLPTTVGSMTFDETRYAWFHVRSSQVRHRKSQDEGVDIIDVPQFEEEEDIFRDIDDLVVSDEEEQLNLGSRPSSSGEVGSAPPDSLTQNHTIENETNVSPKTSPGEKERGSAQEYPQESDPKEEQNAPLAVDAQTSPIVPPKSPLRKSVSCSPLSSPISFAKHHYSLPPSPLRKSLQISIQQQNIPTPKPLLSSPMRSHRKTPSTDKRMRRSIPLPPLDTPEDVRQKSELHISTLNKSQRLPKGSQYEHPTATPLPKLSIQPSSPFLELREFPRLSISPPPGDISFSNTPRQDVSFSITTRVLVKHLTDFEPFEPYWENLRYVDFRGKGVSSLEGLKSFCPKLEEIDIKDCKVKYLTGLPTSMRVLKASGNRLDGLVSFAWAKNIQYLDLANNEIDSLAGFSTLVHLRDLRVDNNLLTSLNGILQLDGLLRVSAKNNQINSLYFVGSRLARLEVLECQKNCIGQIDGLDELVSLMSLHLDDNNITTLQPKNVLRSVRTLKLCRNELQTFDPKLYPDLRTLYLDENQIQSFGGIRRLRFLENFSARSQRGKASINIRGLCELRKVYLSGNPIPLHLECPFYSLQYLELAAVKLSTLPQDLACKLPNVRILNLSFNSLKDITPIRGMALLKRLFLIGNRIGSLGEGTTETLLTLTELQVLDLRLNPITLSFYPPVEAKKSDHHKDMFSLVTGRQGQLTWQQRDKAFRNGMPRSWELRRKAYQGLVYTACPKLKWLDGSDVSRGSVAEGERVLKSLEGVVNSVRITNHEGKP